MQRLQDDVQMRAIPTDKGTLKKNAKTQSANESDGSMRTLCLDVSESLIHPPAACMPQGKGQSAARMAAATA